VIHSFTGGTDGAFPQAGLAIDSAGNLYGTASAGGNTGCDHLILGCGVVFELSQSSTGSWNETTIHTFTGDDGAYPYAPVVLDAAGNVYGTTLYGGRHSNICPGAGCGTAFELSPSSGGTWRETLLHSFTDGSDGGGPESGLVLDAVGNIYGTAFTGGFNGSGVAFRIKP
jgi:hypothetical protein